MTDGASAKRVYVYEVKLTQEDGRGGSGWHVDVVTDTMDPADLLRVAQIGARDQGITNVEEWVGLHEVKLLTTAHLDPRVAV